LVADRMFISISRSLGKKLTATTTVAVAFVLMYEARVMDFRYIASPVSAEEGDEAALPVNGTHLLFATTAYCKGTTTASGVNVRTGIAAADPELLPVGSVVQIYRLGERYNGIYTIMDTGPSVQGRHIDIYMWSCNEALTFGRKDAAINLLRLGWNPKVGTPSLMERLFRQREAAQRADPPPLPSRPIEIH
jgi:3D (Asp-Asp-Asp) domain-containing protein